MQKLAISHKILGDTDFVVIVIPIIINYMYLLKILLLLFFKYRITGFTDFFFLINKQKGFTFWILPEIYP